MFELDAIRTRLQSELRRVRAAGPSAPVADWVDLAGSCQQLINVVAAVQTVALAQVAAIEDVVHEDGTIEEEFRGLGHQRLDAPALVQDLLGLTASGATDRVATAVDLVTRHPHLVDAMSAGRLDAYRAGVVAEELAEASPEVCAEVVARIGARLGTEAGGALRRRTRRELGCVDADLVRRTAERARAERSLRRCAFAPGVDLWSAKVPVEQSRSAWSVVDGLARSYVTDGRCEGIEQARADALMDLLHARATGEITVHLTVPASEVAREGAAADAARDPAGEGGRLVPVTGFGMPGVTHVRACWVESVARQAMSPGDASTSQGANSAPAQRSSTSVDVIACDDTTGALVSLPMSVRRQPRRRREVAAPDADDPGRYRPPPWMIAFVKARDGQCRFPGCAINARFCDVDHVVAWPVGVTHPTNLVCLCRRHHRIKQRPRWRSRLDLDGTLVWTDPAGRQRTTLPLDQLQREQMAAQSHAGRDPSDAVGTDGRGDACPRPEVDPRVEVDARDLSSTVAAGLPSVVEEAFEYLTDGHLVDLACRPGNLTTRNLKALRAGRRVSTTCVEGPASTGAPGTLDVIQPQRHLDATGLVTHGSPRARRATRGSSRDDPPPF